MDAFRTPWSVVGCCADISHVAKCKLEIEDGCCLIRVLVSLSEISLCYEARLCWLSCTGNQFANKKKSLLCRYSIQANF